MLDALAPHSNILRVGYPAQWVFRGCDFGGLGKFGPRVVAAAGRRNCDLGRHAGVGVQAGSGSALPASNVQNQSLSSIAVAPVAPMPSHRLTGSAVFCALDTARRLIASFQTASAMARIAAHRSAPPSSPVGGGGPLSVRARRPHGGRAGQTRIFKKTGLSAPSITGCGCTGFQRARKLRPSDVGSGVAMPYAYAKQRCGPREGANYGIGGVRGRKGALGSYDLGRAATLGGGLG
ncbi:hypothetical protein EDF59_110132 [Novosphingobium sp. ST904]|nr:hypothetical protein EDF59_110132 [Novosphingobium sp. ST904]